MAKKKTDAQAPPKNEPAQWRSKIVGHGKVAASQLLANPFNHRRHPQKQRDVVSASIQELGFIKSVIVNQLTGHIVDGHERVMQALGVGDDTLVDVEYVELSPEDEKKALLVLDASSELAEVDASQLDQLVAECSFSHDGFSELLSGFESIIKRFNIDDVSPPQLADGDREPFRQMTFTVHDSQFEEIEAAIKRAKGKGGGDSAVNENSNGNALAFICEAFRG